jgi:hypothetical protein
VWKAADYAMVDETEKPPQSGAEAFFEIGSGMGRALLESRTAEALVALTGLGPHTFIEPFLLTLAPMLTPGMRTLAHVSSQQATVRLTDDVVPPELICGLIAGLSQALHGVTVNGRVAVSGREATLDLSW